MSLLSNLIETIGLNSSFFYQLALAVALYFISKKLFLQPYLKSLEKRQKLTKGRMKNSKKLEEQIEASKAIYEEKAKSVHEQFQQIFHKIKQKNQQDSLNEIGRLQKEQKEFISKEKEKLNHAIKEQSVLLEKDLPILTKLLVEKIKS